MKNLLFALFAIFAVSCGGSRYVDYFPYHDDGKPKPKVALVPVVDSCGCKLPWDMSQEMSQGVYYQLMNVGELYVMSADEIGFVWNKRDSIDFFGTDMSYAKEFCNSDFIVALELIEHSVRPLEGNSNHSCNQILTMRMRTKVIDVRRSCPKVVLYEIIKSEYIVAKAGPIDFGTTCVGSNGYLMTPCGILHQRMVCNICERLEKVIWTVK